MKTVDVSNRFPAFIDERNLYSSDSLEELERAVETLACRLVFPQYLSLCDELSQSYLTIRLWARDFYRVMRPRQLSLQEIESE